MQQWTFFLFGLLPSQHRDDWNVYNDDAFYDECNNDCKTTQIVKGKQLHSNYANRIGTKRLEFRIKLAEKVFKISSPPSYLNVVKVKPEYIKDIPYLFALEV